MQWLSKVPDPEIPVLSVVDLGLIRDIGWDGATCVVTITPTYSGCPAMQEISSGIREALLEQGIEQLRIETRLSPAWTTDWMSAKGREALQGYGIAPDRKSVVSGKSVSVRVDLGGRRIIKKKNKNNNEEHP